MPFRDRLNSSHPVWKLMLWLGMICLLTLPLMMFAWLYRHDMQNVGYLRMVQTLQSFTVFIIPAVLATWCWSGTPLSDLRMRRVPNGLVFVLVPLLMIAAVPGINLLADLNSRVNLPEALSDLEKMLTEQEEAAKRLTEMFLQADNIGELFSNIFLMALLPAFGEELAFRGTALNLCLNGGRADMVLSRRRAHTAIWVIAVLFSLIHFQFYGFVPRMLLGALFGYMVLWTGSIWTSVLAHFTNNAIAVTAYYIGVHCASGDETSGITLEFFDTLGTGDTLWLGIVSIAVTVGLIAVLRRVAKSGEE